VRKLLTESAWQAVRHSPRIRAWFERIAGGADDRRKIAIVAVARKLAVVMGAMPQERRDVAGGGITGTTDDRRDTTPARADGMPARETPTSQDHRSRRGRRDQLPDPARKTWRTPRRAAE
jgi:hypothetical protein